MPHVEGTGDRMGLRQDILTYSKGDLMETLWKMINMRSRTTNRALKDFLSYWICRSAQKHGGYIGKDTIFKSRPLLPHGLHGIYISRYAVIGSNCWIYQNVTIGEVNGKAPVIGDDCLIGAGAILVGDIHIGNRVKIGAGAVVSQDIPDDCTVVTEAPRIIRRKNKTDE